jgi:hypothetical protein
MREDPSVSKAKQLWTQKQPKEAMLLLIQRINELNTQPDRQSQRHRVGPVLAVGSVLGVVVTLVIVGIVYAAVSNLQWLSDDEQDVLDWYHDLQAGTPLFSTSEEPTPDPHRSGGELNPLSVGEPIVFEQGELKILSVRRPFDQLVHESFGDDTPSRGMELVGIELEFKCAQSEAVCKSPPQGDLILILADGRSVTNDDFYSQDQPLNEDIAGGLTNTGWEIFEVPENAELQTLAIEPYSEDLMIYAILPEATIPQPTITPDTNQPGTLLNPIPAGEEIVYEHGSLKIVNFHRPSAFAVIDLDSFGTDLISEEPVTGTEFVAIEFEFHCDAAETVCEDIPLLSALDLILADERVVKLDTLAPRPDEAVLLRGQDIVGGGTVKGWEIFQVPIGVEVLTLRIEPLEGDIVYAALLQPVDGYTVEQPWQESEEGLETKTIPALRRDLEEAGYPVVSAIYLRGPERTALAITAYTDEILFFEDDDLLEEAKPILLQAVKFWPTYQEEADSLGIMLIDEYTDSSGGTVLADAKDIELFLNGTINERSFLSRMRISRE